MILLKNKKVADEIIRNAINKQTTHCHYTRTVELADDYKRMITGKGVDKWLEMFFREDETVWKQRLKITTPIVKSVLNNVSNRVKKITRIQNVKKSITYTGDNDSIEKSLNLLIKKFNGTGLEKYLEQKQLIGSMHDPNAHLITLFKTVGNKNIPYIVKYSSKESIDFEYNDFGVLEWFLGKKEFHGSTKTGSKVTQHQYYLVAGDIVVRYVFVASKDTKEEEWPLDFKNKKEGSFWESESKSVYWTEVYKVSASKVQAKRIGCIPDVETDGETCISLIDSAMPRLIKVLRSGSNFDLALTLNIFPQKYEYSVACDGTRDEPCNDGFTLGGAKCGVCGGSGKKKITQPDQSKEFILPDNKDDMFDLSKMVYYPEQDISSVKYLEEYINRLENRVYLDIYNTELIPNSGGNLKSIGDVTATEITVKREDINDTLLPLAQHFSSTHVEIVELFAEYTTTTKNILENLSIIYQFPKDLKLSTFGELMADLQAASGSNAPPLVIQQLVEDIVNKVTDGDDLTQKKILIKSKYIPFLGWNTKSVDTALLSGCISWDDAIVYYGQDIIFGNLEMKQRGFYLMSEIELEKTITKEITDYILKVKESKKEINLINNENKKTK